MVQIFTVVSDDDDDLSHSEYTIFSLIINKIKFYSINKRFSKYTS